MDIIKKATKAGFSGSFIHEHLDSFKSLLSNSDDNLSAADKSETEHLLFEDWMKSNRWIVWGVWNGSTYVSDPKDKGLQDLNIMNTRQLWAVWQARSKLEK